MRLSLSTTSGEGRTFASNSCSVSHCGLDGMPSLVPKSRRDYPRAMALDGLISDHLADLAAIAARHGVRSVRLFGSRARGTATDASDVDLLVELDRGRGLLDLVGFKQETERVLGRPVDVVTEPGLSPYLRDRILAEARTLEIRAA